MTAWLWCLILVAGAGLLSFGLAQGYGRWWFPPPTTDWSQGSWQTTEGVFRGVTLTATTWVSTARDPRWVRLVAGLARAWPWLLIFASGLLVGHLLA